MRPQNAVACQRVNWSNPLSRYAIVPAPATAGWSDATVARPRRLRRVINDATVKTPALLLGSGYWADRLRKSCHEDLLVDLCARPLRLAY